jgi:8-oxo-dGTP pyrophosphatase MutT (NUDIX family)
LTPAEDGQEAGPAPDGRDGFHGPAHDVGPVPDGQDAGPAPQWLLDLGTRAAEMPVAAPLRPPPDGGRESAVLMLVGSGHDGADLLLTQRSHGLRRHAGQAAFPGGAIDPADGGPVDAALREAAEETGLEASGVEVLAVLPEQFVARSGFRVTPVLGWWRRPCAVAPADPAEVAAVVRVPLADLADPANRFVAQHPSGRAGPAFHVRGLLVWGFTAGLVDRLLAFSGWERPWDSERVRDLPPGALGRAANG